MRPRRVAIERLLTFDDGELSMSNTNSREQASTPVRTGLLRSRRTKLLAGALALGLAGAFTAQTVVPSGQFALADPVKVDAPAPADFSAVVAAVQPAVVSVKVAGDIEQVNDDRRGGPRFDFRGRPDFFDDLPKDHPFRRFFREDRRGDGERGEGRRFGRRGDDDHGKRRPHRRFDLGQGSGFFISEDGYLVTNQHVVERGSAFTVVLDDGTELDAELVGADERTDLALLKVKENGHTFTYVDFAEEAPKVGEWVVAVGNPFGLGGTVTAGIVSARGRDIGAGPYDDFIQIDAPVNRGNSGGPAFNTKGEVIGINAAIFSPSGGNVGIAFAIPAETAKQIVADLKDDGHVVRGWLGVQIQPVSRDIADSLNLEKARGALVAETPEEGPAKEAGIQTGDAILAVDGKQVKGPRQLARMIAGYAPGAKVNVTVWRDGAEKEIAVELGTLPGKQAAANADGQDATPTSLQSLGLELAGARDAGLDQDGVVVTGVEPGSPAAERGLRQGDVIVEADGKAVGTPDDVIAGIEAAQKDGKKAVLFRIVSSDRSRFVALPAPRS